MCAGVAVVAWWWCFPNEDAAHWQRGAPPRVWAYRAAQENSLREQHLPIRSQFHYVPSHAISPDLQLAVLVAEDTGFFSHGSVDLDEVREALLQWYAGRRLRGASTITQQLAKNLFTSGERTWWRKIIELRMAWWLERQLSKARIFELYLNVIEFGPGVYGSDAAARYYFDVTAAEVDSGQAASIAAAIPAPTLSNPFTQSRAFDVRRKAVVERMARLRHLRTVLEQLARR